MSRRFFFAVLLAVSVQCAAQQPATQRAFWMSDSIVPGWMEYNFQDADQFRKIKANHVRSKRQYSCSPQAKDKIAEYRYDRSGHVTEFRIIPSDDTLRSFERYTYRYNNCNQLIEECDSNMGRVTIFRYYYDAHGRRWKADVFDKNNVLTSSQSCIYDQKGRLIRMETNLPLGGITSQNIYEYNAQGLLSCQYTLTRGKTFSKVTYERNAQGQVTRRYLYNVNGSDSIESYYDYTYDKQGRTVTMVWHLSNGEQLQVHEFGYDAAGNLIQHQAEHSRYGTTFLTSCYYDEKQLEFKEINNNSTERYTLLVYEFYGADTLIQPSNILFARGESLLSEESIPALDSLAGYLLAHAGVLIQVNGHTDNQGTEADNQELSEERAKVAAAYLVGKGIAPQRISCRGYGSIQPWSWKNTEEGWKQNRRVEFVLLNP